MGAWGYEPWDNDDAADLFVDLISPKFVKQIDKALRMEAEEYHEKIRAAAYVLSVLGHTYIWPVDHLVPQLKLALEALQGIKDSGVLDEGDEVDQRIDQEIEALKVRLQSIERGDAN